MNKYQKFISALLNNASLVFFIIVLLLFGSLSSKFLTLSNLLNIVTQGSSTAILAIGMTFVLLTAGVDLSVGAIMFVSAAVAGKLMARGCPVFVAMALIPLLGMLFGAVNAAFITRIKLVPFIVTLATLYVGRGFALWLTETRAMNLPEEFQKIGASSLLGIPVPILTLLAVGALAHFVLKHTPFGRQVYAVGNNLEHARKAGIPARSVLMSAYVISGLCAGIACIVSLAQLGAVSPTFGNQKEFTAIAAAVLGGASLFGGRGQVFPGTIIGALLIQTVENGLNIVNADPYIYPLVTSVVIFVAVLIDCTRHKRNAVLHKRKIRMDHAA
jgi:ribose transport system permease protein